MKIVFDSFALIAHFRKENGHEIVSELLAEIFIGEKQGFMSAINVGEVYYMLYKKFDPKAAEHSLHVIKGMPIDIVNPDFEMTMAAARLKAKYKFSYADAFAAALTIAHRATLITGDNEFKELVGEPHFKVRFI